MANPAYSQIFQAMNIDPSSAQWQRPGWQWDPAMQELLNSGAMREVSFMSGGDQPQEFRRMEIDYSKLPGIQNIKPGAMLGGQDLTKIQSWVPVTGNVHNDALIVDDPNYGRITPFVNVKQDKNWMDYLGQAAKVAVPAIIGIGAGAMGAGMLGSAMGGGALASGLGRIGGQTLMGSVFGRKPSVTGMLGSALGGMGNVGRVASMALPFMRRGGSRSAPPQRRQPMPQQRPIPNRYEGSVQQSLRNYRSQNARPMIRR